MRLSDEQWKRDRTAMESNMLNGEPYDSARERALPSTKLISIIGALAFLALILTAIWIDYQWDQDHRNYYAAGLFNGANHAISEMRECSRLGLTAEEFNARMKAWEDSIKLRVSVTKVPDPFQP